MFHLQYVFIFVVRLKSLESLNTSSINLLKIETAVAILNSQPI